MNRLYIVLLSLFPVFTYGQGAFVIMNVKGTVTVQKEGKTSAAKIGMWLSGNEHLIVQDKSEATLVCKSDGYIVCNKPGDYNTASFTGKCQAPKNNIVSNYLKFAWEEFAHKEEGSAPGNDSKMENVGAAVRGLDKCYATIDSSLRLLNYSSGNFVLSWKRNVGAALSLKIFEYPDGGAPVLVIPVKENKYALDKLAASLKKGNYFWTVVPAHGQEQCERNQVQLWEQSDYELLLNSIAAEAVLLSTDKAFQAYFTGQLLEEQHFLAEAYQFYIKANALAPANDKYISSVTAFKKRYSL